MKKVLVTGGTVFVSRYVAEYYVRKGYEVYVLNRNTRVQPDGMTLIEADRHRLGNRMKKYYFDVVLDITAYTRADIAALLDGLGNFDDYVMISSSAVYPETGNQPFKESEPVGANKFWGAYGTDKIEAEKELIRRVPHAYILRPPYIYGPMNDVYREAFVFECALQGRRFYLPRDGEMKLQFFYVGDLCRFMDCILEKKPKQHIYNVGNRETISVKDWVSLCYQVAGKIPEFVPVYEDIDQRKYFSFYDYEYVLDVTRYSDLMNDVMDMGQGLQEAFQWYLKHSDQVERRYYMSYIDENLI